MAQRLTANVLVRHPETGVATCLRAGSELPAWAAGLVDGSHVLSDGAGTATATAPQATPSSERPGARTGATDATAAATAAAAAPANTTGPAATAPAAHQTLAGSDGPPPRTGRGSSDAAWASYARAQRVSVTDDMRRAEIIAACEAAGVATD